MRIVVLDLHIYDTYGCIGGDKTSPSPAESGGITVPQVVTQLTHGNASSSPITHQQQHQHKQNRALLFCHLYHKLGKPLWQGSEAINCLGGPSTILSRMWPYQKNIRLPAKARSDSLRWTICAVKTKTRIKCLWIVEKLDVFASFNQEKMWKRQYCTNARHG